MRVLLPTDFSKNAFNAMAYASKLFKNVECTFYLLHTYTPAFYRTEYVLQSPGQFGLGDVFQTLAMEQIAAEKEKLMNAFPNPKHTWVTHTSFNILTDEVNEFSEKEHIDLIVMGTQGATGAKEIFLGTHTVHVIKQAKIPVLAIPPEFEYEVPKEILFPTDYEVDYDENQLNVLIQIAKTHLSSIEVLHVSEGYELRDFQKKNQQKLDSMLSKVAHLFHDWPNREIIQAVNEFQLKYKTQMLAMIRNKHSFIEKLFVEPIIKKISFHLTIPFLVMPYKTED